MIRKSLVAAGVLVAALGMTACSSDDSTEVETTTATTSAVATSASTAAAPAVDVLQQQLTTFFDPAVPVAEKAAVIEQGAQRTPQLEQFNGVLTGYPLTAKVGEVTAEDATVTAVTEIAGPHGGAPVPVTFAQVSDTWVISDASTCELFGMGRVSC